MMLVCQRCIGDNLSAATASAGRPGGKDLTCGYIAALFKLSVKLSCGCEGAGKRSGTAGAAGIASMADVSAEAGVPAWFAGLRQRL